VLYLSENKSDIFLKSLKRLHDSIQRWFTLRRDERQRAILEHPVAARNKYSGDNSIILHKLHKTTNEKNPFIGKLIILIN
jgi:hypothetical protein